MEYDITNEIDKFIKSEIEGFHKLIRLYARRNGYTMPRKAKIFTSEVLILGFKCNPLYNDIRGLLLYPSDNYRRLINVHFVSVIKNLFFADFYAGLRGYMSSSDREKRDTIIESFKKLTEDDGFIINPVNNYL